MNEQDLPIGVKNIAKYLKPFMSSFLGQLGEGMNIMIFDSPKNIEKKIVELDKKNTFSLQWESIKVKWILPFYSILPSKFCKVDNEEMKGNWFFCPQHGNKL